MKDRIYSLDALKTIAAFLVCYQHARGSGIISGYILSFAVIAVPIFMMLTGFMYEDIVKRGNEKKQIFKFLKIAIEMELLWIAINVFTYSVKHHLGDFLSQYAQPNNMIGFIFFNDPVAADHGWYIWAVLYALIIVYFFPRVIYSTRIKWSIILGGELFLVLCGKYSPLVLGIDIPSYITRNFLGEGLPFLLMGTEIRKWYDKGNMPTKKKVTTLFVISVILLIIEKSLLLLSGNEGTRESCIMTPIIATIVICYFLVDKNVNKQSVLSKIGLKYSLIIYIIHPLFVRIEKKVIPMDTWMQYIGVVAVFLMALLTAVMWERILQIYKSRVKRKLAK